MARNKNDFDEKQLPAEPLVRITRYGPGSDTFWLGQLREPRVVDLSQVHIPPELRSAVDAAVRRPQGVAVCERDGCGRPLRRGRKTNSSLCSECHRREVRKARAAQTIPVEWGVRSLAELKAQLADESPIKNDPLSEAWAKARAADRKDD